MIPQAIIYIIVFIVSFMSLYLIQSVLGIILNGPIGLFIAIFNFIHQVDVISQKISENLLYPMPLQFLFDTVLAREGYDEVVVRGKTFRSVPVPWVTSFKRWVFDLPNNFILYPMTGINLVLSIVLNFVPVIGPVVLIFIDAPGRGVSFHKRYYQLKGIDTRQRNAFYASKRFQYIGFGIICGIFEQIPVFSTLFVFTSTTGAAIWASRIESHVENREYKNKCYIIN